MTEGERLKELRKNLGMTLEKFGDSIGLKKSALSHIETGRNSLTQQTRLAVCNRFHVRLEWLRDGIGEMHEEATEDEEIGRLFESVKADAGFNRRLAHALANLGEDEWEAIEAFARRLVEEESAKTPEAAETVSP